MLLLSAWSCCQLRRSIKCLRLSEALQPPRSILPGLGRRHQFSRLSESPAGLHDNRVPVGCLVTVFGLPGIPACLALRCCFARSHPPPLLPEAMIFDRGVFLIPSAGGRRYRCQISRFPSAGSSQTGLVNSVLGLPHSRVTVRALDAKIIL